MDPHIGEIRLFGLSYAPVGWVTCNGQLLLISENEALFGVLGAHYGGNGITTFAVPDLRGRIPIHVGQGPGLSNYTWGQQGGTEIVTLQAMQMPTHTHAVMASSDYADSTSPQGTLPAVVQGQTNFVSDLSGARAVTMGGATIGVAGSSQPHNNMMPTIPMYFYIAAVGIYPSQN